METQTDSELIKLIQAGDSAQLGHLFERHHVALFRYLYQLTRNRALSEDLTQDVFLRVLKYASSYKAGFEFRTWVFRMARNACHDARHKVRGEMADADLTGFRSLRPIPDEELGQQQDTRLLQRALDALPEDKREVLELSRFQEMRYGEIARVLKCEVGTVRVRAYRALNELRAKFLELQGGGQTR